MELEMLRAGAKEVRLNVIDEKDGEVGSRSGSSSSSASSSRESSSTESHLVPGSMPSSFQVESPRKVPKRMKKRSIYFSQLEKEKMKGGGGGGSTTRKSGFNRTALVLLAFNVIQAVALVVTVLSANGKGNEGEGCNAVSSTSGSNQGGTGTGTGGQGVGPNPYGSLKDTERVMFTEMSQYLVDLSVGWDNFTQDFGKDRLPMQTKVIPPWSLGPLDDDALKDYLPLLAPSLEPEQYFLDPAANQAMLVYERFLNLSLTTNTQCFFTNYAIGSFIPNANNPANASDLVLGSVSHFEREGNCQYRNLPPSFLDSGSVDDDKAQLVALLAPYVKSTFEKTMRYPCTSYEELRVTIVQELLGVLEARARTNLVADQQALVDSYLSQFFADDAEGFIRGATGQFVKYSGPKDLVKALFARQSFVATRHRIIAQNFDVSVVSEVAVVDPNEPRRDWFDTASFTFTGLKEEGKSASSTSTPSTLQAFPKIQKVFFSYHN